MRESLIIALRWIHSLHFMMALDLWLLSQFNLEKRFARICIVELEDDPGRRYTLIEDTIHCTSYNIL